MQGVAISIFIKDDKRQGKLADVFYLDSYGKREDKYQKLWELKLNKKNFFKNFKTLIVPLLFFCNLKRKQILRQVDLFRFGILCKKIIVKGLFAL